jgi:hypothetical protein
MSTVFFTVRVSLSLSLFLRVAGNVQKFATPEAQPSRSRAAASSYTLPVLSSCMPAASAVVFFQLGADFTKPFRP